MELSEVPDDGTTAAMSLDLEGVSHGIVNVGVRFVPVGPALDVMAGGCAAGPALTCTANVGAKRV